MLKKEPFSFITDRCECETSFGPHSLPSQGSIFTRTTTCPPQNPFITLAGLWRGDKNANVESSSGLDIALPLCLNIEGIASIPGCNLVEILTRRRHWQKNTKNKSLHSSIIGQTTDFLRLCPASMDAAEVNKVHSFALNGRERRRKGFKAKNACFSWLFSEKLGTVLFSLKISSLLSFFLPLVCSVAFICQLFQHTKHCSSLCTSYQRARSSRELRFGLKLGLAVSLSQIYLYITHCRGILVHSCVCHCVSC